MVLFLNEAYNELMKKSERNLYLEKLKGGLNENDQAQIDRFYQKLLDQIDMPIIGRDLLIQHFMDAFSYYLERGRNVDEICGLLDPSYLGNFYQGEHRTSFSLDNAAIVYPLGMRYAIHFMVVDSTIMMDAKQSL